MLNSTSNNEFYKKSVWSVANICTSRPLPPLDRVEIAIPTLAKIMKKENNLQILRQAACSLSILTRHGCDTQAFVDTGVLPSIVNHLK